MVGVVAFCWCFILRLNKVFVFINAYFKVTWIDRFAFLKYFEFSGFVSVYNDFNARISDDV